MTVGVAVKVFDGIVLAADSATTLELKDAEGHVVGHQVYSNAHKVFHLHRDLPIAGMTWGLGQIGNASISTLAKDLRQRLMGKDPNHMDWDLHPDAYTVGEVANRVVEHLFHELYVHHVPPGTVGAVLGFAVAGYSAGSNQAELWQIDMDAASANPVPEQVGDPDTFGWWAFAQPDPVSRLFNGLDDGLFANLAGLPNADPNAIVKAVQARQVNPAIPAMPLADAISLAHFMVDVTVGFRRYTPGPDTVGGPVDVASISRHEGFRWVDRKYYYPAHLNPKDPHP